MTQKSELLGIVAANRRECGEEIIAGAVREWANCHTAYVDPDGDVWVENPQTGHWLSADELAEFIQWDLGR